jgi:hypothetical protein
MSVSDERLIELTQKGVVTRCDVPLMVSEPSAVRLVEFHRSVTRQSLILLTVFPLVK